MLLLAHYAVFRQPKINSWREHVAQFSDMTNSANHFHFTSTQLLVNIPLLSEKYYWRPLDMTTGTS